MDHQEMIQEAKNDGLSDEELSLKFGNPKKVAFELYQDSIKGNNNEKNKLIDEGRLKGFELLKTFNNVSDFKEVSIELANEDVMYLPSEENTIKVYVKDLDNESNYDFDYNKGFFTLQRVGGKRTIKIFQRNSNVTFAIVASPAKLQKFNLSLVTGDYEFERLETVEMCIKSTSGDGEFNDVFVAETLEIKTVSGDVKLNNTKANNLETTLVSGELELNNVEVTSNIYINSVSGDVEAANTTCEYLNFRSVSGDFDGNEVYVKRVEIKTVSGDFEIENDSKEQTIEVVEKKTVSGDVTIK
jgi:DUF4097 and DUF4098 domain-containing protein YvlB